jgi:DNA topoisomerase IA
MGFSAQETLDTAQALSERHKLISYPYRGQWQLLRDACAFVPGHRDQISDAGRRQLPRDAPRGREKFRVAPIGPYQDMGCGT